MMKNKSENTHIFFITSYGRTATNWICRFLNTHKDIYCTQGPSLELPFARDLNLFLENSHKPIHETQDQYYSLSLDEIVQGMREKKESKIYGNIHAFTAANFSQKLSSEAISYSYKWVNIIRHPFTRIQSFMNQWLKGENNNDSLTKQLKNAAINHPTCQNFKEIVNHYYVVDFSEVKNLFFLYALVQQGSDLSDILEPCEHLKYEYLMQDEEYFKKFFYLIMGEALLWDENLSSLFSLSQRTNATQIKNIYPLQVAQGWEKWQLMLVRYWLKSSPETREMYTQLGYDVDFIFEISL